LATGVFIFFRDDVFQPKDEHGWKIINMIPHLPIAWWLSGIAIILTVGMFEASFRLSRELHHELASLTDNRKRARISLGEFISQGNTIMSRCLVERSGAPNNDANVWAEKVECFLGTSLDQSYIARFRDTSNALDVRPVGKFSEETIQLWSALRIRITHLSEFIKEMSA
jgi:hypothetical protein